MFLPEPVGCNLFFSIDIHPVLKYFRSGNTDFFAQKKERKKAHHTTIVHYPSYI
jgi:hypothetical protein